MTETVENYDAVIVGAGAAGLMCALEAGRQGRRILLLEHNEKPGAKILISGGGRCNFTNQDAHPSAYISRNPHFVKSALSRYSPQDFMSLLSTHGVTWHEKTLGQLFCDQGAKKILSVLLSECEKFGVKLLTDAKIHHVRREQHLFRIETQKGVFESLKMIVATGGLSIPKMGSTGFAYEMARQFGLNMQTPEPALVPFVFADQDLRFMKALAGVATDAVVSTKGMSFKEALLFTHRGLSGPAILQISSYWQAGNVVTVNLLPEITDSLAWLKDARSDRPKMTIKALLAEQLPARLAEAVAADWRGPLGGFSNKQLVALSERLSRWQLRPAGTEGFKKAEVTRGGIDTSELSSKTMEAKKQPGLYFIGECVDVTGWLGGYNFQWAWASGWAAAQNI